MLSSAVIVSWIAPSASERYSYFILHLGKGRALNQLRKLNIGEGQQFSCRLLENRFLIFLDVVAFALGKTIDEESFLSLFEYDDDTCRQFSCGRCQATRVEPSYMER